MKIKEITLQKEITIPIAPFSNFKVSVSITSTDDDFESTWKKLNEQLEQQENLERSLRLPTPKPPVMDKGWKPVDDMPF